jgi:germination protein M
MKKYVTGLSILLLVLLSLVACDNKSKDSGSENQTEVEIYYINSKTSGLVSESYVLTGTTKEQKVDELLIKLAEAPENIVYKSALPENVVVRDSSFDSEGLLTIDFEATYDEISGIDEVLCRASIVKTICQISEVEFIQFNVNGQRLKDSNDSYVGLMTAEDFIENTSTNTNYKVNLYFANEDGTALIEYVTDINYTGIGSIEELVIKQLINGPTEMGMYETIPEGTILLNVTTKEGICYVDFNEKFLEKLQGISEEVAIYSIVNTLTELPNISKVQFLINSGSKKTFLDGRKLDEIFERNLSIIEETK